MIGSLMDGRRRMHHRIKSNEGHGIGFDRHQGQRQFDQDSDLFTRAWTFRKAGAQPGG
jgi:hypothetical protein